jgi:flagellar assembly protein FliH
MKAMSNSPLIPKEKLSAYQRWELHAFDGPKEKVAPVVNPAEVEAEKVRHIHQHAYNAGREDGLREAACRATDEARHLTALLSSIAQKSHEIDQRIAHDVLALALEIARQMLRRTLAVRPEVILDLIHDAQACAAQPVAAATIALNPADAVLVREHIGNDLAAAGWKIIEDATIERGGARLQTAANLVDATVETRWHKLTAALGQDSAWMA